MTAPTLANRLRVMLASLASRSAAGWEEPTAECTMGNGGKQEVRNDGGFSVWEVLFLVSLLLNTVLVTLAFAWRYRRSPEEKRLAEATSQTRERAKSGRNVSAQSQTTYAMNRAQPRFIPLADHAHGAWVESA